MTAYQAGFISKCREMGLDANRTADLLKTAEGEGEFGQYTNAVKAYAPKDGTYEFVNTKPDNWITRNAKRYGPSFLLRLGVFGKNPGFVYSRTF